MKLDCLTTDERFHDAILELRNTPRDDGNSPNQIVFGHPLRSIVPMHQNALHSTDHRIENARRKRQIQEENVKARYDKSAKDLPKFSVGDTVRIKDPRNNDWNKIGETVQIGIRNRCYLIKLPNNRIPIYIVNAY